jgi:hypothetical protein
MSIKMSNYAFIDWDDTLFPTSWTVNNTIDIKNKNSLFLFKSLDDTLSQFLLKLQKFCIIVIITNALTSWVNLTLTVLPSTNLIMKNIKIVSARELYQNKYEMMDWKKHTFKYILHNMLVKAAIPKSQFINIISIGDAEYEYNALIDLNNWAPDRRKTLKAIKLITSPSLDILLDELRILYKAAPFISNSRKYMDLKFADL